MKIGVCVKVTPDTDARIKVASSGDGIDPSGIKWILSPYDAYAVEQGVLTQEKLGGEVILFTVGSKDAQTQLRGSGLAVGCDRAVIVEDAGIDGTDALAVARALAAAIRAEGCDLVFCGKVAIDDQNVQVPGMLAELLGWAQVSMASEFDTDATTFTATRGMGGGVEEVVSGALPAVITAERGLNTPRYAKLPAIMKAKKKPIDIKSASDLGLSASDIASGLELSGWSMPPGRPSGRILEGDAATTAAELVRLLREEAKVI